MWEKLKRSKQYLIKIPYYKHLGDQAVVLLSSWRSWLPLQTTGREVALPHKMKMLCFLVWEAAPLGNCYRTEQRKERVITETSSFIKIKLPETKGKTSKIPACPRAETEKSSLSVWGNEYWVICSPVELELGQKMLKVGQLLRWIS